MRTSFPWRPAPSDENPFIEQLRSENVRDLRLPWHSRFSASTLVGHLSTSPGMSLWVPATGEYAIGEQWRRRDEITQVLEVSARKGRAALVRRLLERFREESSTLALCTDDVWRDGERVYTSLGFSHIEKIVFFRRELPGSAWGEGRAPAPPEGELRFEPVGPTAIARLMPLDHTSFPWLWWNSLDEFGTYLVMQGVYAYVCLLDGEDAGYVSFTMYNGWAHLDRLAVVESMQGRGLGAAMLRFVLGNMSIMGAGSVGLSTQVNNTRSHKLYRSFGFKQSAEGINFYGLDL
ncbi:MAG: GNAT family N-acetyltransferase [Chloroflexota bacterium]|nr:GNAT family N-acetyltransferase [Chloroflexota bacterium]